MGLRRSARRHQTSKTAVDSAVFNDYAVGQHVMTKDGIPGVITDLQEGPFPQTEAYFVVLDDGMGEGWYATRDIVSEVASATAAVVSSTQVGEYTVPQPVDDPSLHLASEDYPELSEILYERPPLAHAETLRMSAAKMAATRPLRVTYVTTDAAGTLKVNRVYFDYYEDIEDWAKTNGPAFDGTIVPNIPESYVKKTYSRGLIWWNNRWAVVDMLADPETTVLYREGGKHKIVSTGAIPLVCSVCGETYFTDSLDERHGCAPSTAGLVETDEGDLEAVSDYAEPLPPTTPIIPGDVSESTEEFVAEAFDDSVREWATESDKPLVGVPVADEFAEVDTTPEQFDQMWSEGTPADISTISPDELGFEASLESEGGFLDMLDRGTQYIDQHNNHKGPSGAGSWSYDWCRFRRDRGCYYPKDMDLRATELAGYAVWVPLYRGVCGRDAWPDQKACSVAEPGPKSGDPGARLDATVPWEQGGQRGGVTFGSRMTVEAAFEFTATWADVRNKARTIRQSGGVSIVSAVGDKGTGQTVTGEIRGSSAVYETSITSAPGTTSVALWTCGCPWAAYSWGRSGRWKKYEGRMCAHALALTYEVQSRGMFGKNVVEDTERPDWAKEVQRPGDYVPPKSASLRPVLTDGELAASPAAMIAASMLQEGSDATTVLAHFGEKVVHEALTMDFKGRLKVLIRGIVKTVKEIVTEKRKVIFTDGSEALISDVQYPTFHPNKGLNFQSALALGAEEPTVDATGAYYTPEDIADPVVGPQIGEQIASWVQAVQRDEPEPALPTTTAEPEDENPLSEEAIARRAAALGTEVQTTAPGADASDADIAAAADAFLAKTALKDFTAEEQRQIIEEGEGDLASNLDGLNLAGTHYESLEAAFREAEQSDDLF